MDTQERIANIIAEELNIKLVQVVRTIELINEGNTIPFIARYRKEVTGGLSDETLRDLGERLTYLRNLEARKDEVKTSIENQGKLTDEIVANLENAKTLAEVEDIYRPYKQKKKTRATVAKAKGLEPLAEIILAQTEKIPIEEIAKQSKSKQSKELCIKKKIDSFKETIEKETRKLEVMYDDRLAGIITLDEYMKNANRIKECVKGYEQSIIELEQELSGENDKTKSESRLDNLIEEFLNMEKPTKEIIREFIDKIEIHSDKQVDIYFNFKPLQELNNNFSVAKKEYEKKAV